MSLNTEQKAILKYVENMLEQGDSFSINKLEIPKQEDQLADVMMDVQVASNGRPCIQLIILPSGEKKCVKYAD